MSDDVLLLRYADSSSECDTQKQLSNDRKIVYSTTVSLVSTF